MLYIYIQKKPTGEIYGYKDQAIGKNSIGDIVSNLLWKTVGFKNTRYRWNAKRTRKVKYYIYTPTVFRNSMMTLSGAAGLAHSAIAKFTFHTDIKTVDRYLRDYEHRKDYCFSQAQIRHYLETGTKAMSIKGI